MLRQTPSWLRIHEDTISARKTVLPETSGVKGVSLFEAWWPFAALVPFGPFGACGPLPGGLIDLGRFARLDRRLGRAKSYQTDYRLGIGAKFVCS